MADTPIDERKFSDEEVREILKRAVQRAPSRALMKREGLSLAELKSIGEEVGIDPSRLEDAARSVALGGRNQPNLLLGGPVVLDFERKVEGTLDPNDTPEILSTIRRGMGTQGEVDEIHGSLEWRAKGDSGERYVTLSSRDGTTTLRASSNLTNLAVVTYLPAGIVGTILAVVGFIVAAESGSPAGILLSFSALPILYGSFRALFRRFTNREATKLEQVVNDLARLTEGSGGDSD